jgi:two-component system chemotaxis response regulator CheY
MKILIVDDDIVSAELLCHYLGSYGECEVASNGVIALEKVDKSLLSDDYYGLICLDIVMPKMDGKEVLARVRELEEKKGKNIANSAKILMVSALTDPSTIMGSYGSRCNGYLPKPIERKNLERQLMLLGIQLPK